MSSQLHSLDALTLGIVFPTSTEQEDGCSSKRVWKYWERGNLLSMPGIEPQCPQLQIPGMLKGHEVTKQEN
jgi:hypothetical protein